MKYLLYPFFMLLYMLITLFLSLAYFFMVFIDTLSEAHKSTLSASEDIRGYCKMLKLWITGKN